MFYLCEIHTSVITVGVRHCLLGRSLVGGKKKKLSSSSGQQMVRLNCNVWTYLY